MTAMLTPFDGPPALRAEEERTTRDPDPIRRELLSLRARVRALTAERAQLAADGLTHELRILSRETASAVSRACEGRPVLARLHLRLTRQLNADLLRPSADDERSVEARARAVVLAQLDALLEAPEPPRSRRAEAYAHADLTPGAVKAVRIFEQHRETVRSRFRELKCRLQSDLADLSQEIAAETGARLRLQHGEHGSEWLRWRLQRVVEELVKVPTPPSLAASLELLAIRSLLSESAARRRSALASR